MAARRITRLVPALMITLAAWFAGASPAGAHDNIASSSPSNGDVLPEPIDHVTIDFGEEISDAVQMFLRYEAADGEVEQIGGTVSKTGPTTARLDFPLLELEGTYFVNYIGPVPADGHVITGAIGFVYGTPTAYVSDDPNVTSSAPFARETIDETISQVDVEFAGPVTNVRFFFSYDEGDGENFTPIAVQPEQTADETFVVRFDPLESDGTYILSYLGEYAQNDEEISGDIPFFLGEPSSAPSSSYPWIPVVAIGAIVIAIGAYLSFRSAVVGDEDSADADEDLADVGV